MGVGEETGPETRELVIEDVPVAQLHEPGSDGGLAGARAAGDEESGGWLSQPAVDLLEDPLPAREVPRSLLKVGEEWQAGAEGRSHISSGMSASGWGDSSSRQVSNQAPGRWGRVRPVPRPHEQVRRPQVELTDRRQDTGIARTGSLSIFSSSPVRCSTGRR